MKGKAYDANLHTLNCGGDLRRGKAVMNKAHRWSGGIHFTSLENVTWEEKGSYGKRGGGYSEVFTK